MKQLLFALGALAAQAVQALPAGRANELAIPAPPGRAAAIEDAALNAQAWVVRHHWGWRSHRRRWSPECVVGWEHFYWWGHRYSCYYRIR